MDSFLTALGSMGIWALLISVGVIWRMFMVLENRDRAIAILQVEVAASNRVMVKLASLLAIVYRNPDILEDGK